MPPTSSPIATLVPTGLLALALSCSTVAGIDEDYHVVNAGDASAGAPGGGGVATGGFAGSSGFGASGGVSGGSGGAGGSGGSGNASGTGGGGTGGASGASGTGGGAGCASLGKTCLPAVPSGWTGPVAIKTSTGTPSACPSEFPTETGPYFSGLQYSIASCQCSCASPTGATCSSAVLSQAGTCGSPGSTVAVVPSGGTCTSVPLLNAGQVKASGTVSGGSCVPQANHTIAPPVWSGQVRICEGASTAGICNGTDVCAPTLQPSEACAYRLGTFACPTEYPVGTSYFMGYTDSRDCTSCTCGPVSGSCLGVGTVSFHTQSDCTDASTTTVAPGGCIPAASASAYAAYTGGTPVGGSCLPGGASPVGTVVADGELTVCCQN
ncbi:MAG: hypothetical protein R3B13_34995 [Polyangiaceae bacterium]